jgi:hypothetical protein
LIEPEVSEEVVIDRALFTVMDLLAMSTAAVGVCESVTWTLKLVGPKAVGVPLITPAALMLRPGGNVPDASAHVKGCRPPMAVRVAEYGTLMTAVGSGGVALMIKGPTGMGGRPLLQEGAKPQTHTQMIREKERFNADMNVLMALEHVPRGVQLRPPQLADTIKKLKVLRRTQEEQVGIPATQHYGKRSQAVTHTCYL